MEAGANLIQPILEKRLTLQTEIAPQLPQLRAHAGKLKQILLNLAINARDAMPTSGELRISAQLCPVSEAEAAGRPGARAGRHICLSVADTGCGMDEATQQRIFLPFFTTKAAGGGTGLGLALVQQLVAQQHGWITLESQPGKGTTFRIYLPLPLESAVAA